MSTGRMLPSESLEYYSSKNTVYHCVRAVRRSFIFVYRVIYLLGGRCVRLNHVNGDDIITSLKSDDSHQCTTDQNTSMDTNQDNMRITEVSEKYLPKRCGCKWRRHCGSFHPQTLPKQYQLYYMTNNTFDKLKRGISVHVRRMCLYYDTGQRSDIKRHHGYMRSKSQSNKIYKRMATDDEQRSVFVIMNCQDATRDMATRDMATKDMTTRDMTTRDMTTRDMATRDMATRDMATKDMTTRDMATRDMATSDKATRDIDMATKDMTIRDMATKDMTTRDIATKDMATRDMTTRDMATSDKATRDIDMATKVMTTRDMAIRDMTTRDMTTRDMATSDKATRDIDMTTRDMAIRDIATKDMTTRGIATRDTTILDLSPEQQQIELNMKKVIGNTFSSHPGSLPGIHLHGHLLAALGRAHVWLSSIEHINKLSTKDLQNEGLNLMKDIIQHPEYYAIQFKTSTDTLYDCVAICYQSYVHILSRLDSQATTNLMAFTEALIHHGLTELVSLEMEKYHSHSQEEWATMLDHTGVM